MDKFSSFFLSKLIKTVKDSGLLTWGDRILIAVSGGVDSTVLLYSLYELRHYFGITLACASFDHKIRPSSHEDILFVSGLCKKFSLPFYTEQADARDYAKKLKLNLDEIKVESFETIDSESIRKGTIQAYLAPTGAFSCMQTCDTCDAVVCDSNPAYQCPLTNDDGGVQSCFFTQVIGCV